jgi:tRNA (guanine37-N1)-methyltransferase
VQADSFASGLLDFPAYTRPRVFRGRAVPEVLLGGNHAAIDAWRLGEAARITLRHRPDLIWADWDRLSPDARRVIAAVAAEEGLACPDAASAERSTRV